MLNFVKDIISNIFAFKCLKKNEMFVVDLVKLSTYIIPNVLFKVTLLRLMDH